MIEFLPQNNGQLVALKFSGKITHQEFEALAPMLDVQIEKDGGHIQLLLNLIEFDGWDGLHAIWEHFVLVKDHHNAVQRIAVLGDKEWERRLAEVMARFIDAEVGYYEGDELEQALTWLAG